MLIPIDDINIYNLNIQDKTYPKSDGLEDFGIKGNTLELGLSGHILGPELRKLRDKKHIKATGLIDKGYSSPLISQIEKGLKRKISIQLIYEYSEILDVDFYNLLRHLVRHQANVLENIILKRD